MKNRVFDGHNDALSRLWCANDDPVVRFKASTGHVNAPDCRDGAMVGGFFAIFSAPQRQTFDMSSLKPSDLTGPLPPAMEEQAALVSAIGQAGIAQRLDDADLIKVVTSSTELDLAIEDSAIACILHLEGADCIGPDLLALDALFAQGLRSLGPVWSRPTIFGEGVPFGFDQDGDTGPGLTEHGRRLIGRCKELGVIVDTSHMTTKGFWDTAELDFPLVATHSNTLEHCNTTRNLADDQLHAIGESQGMVGLNFATVFLDPAAWDDGHCSPDFMVRHLAHMVETAGENHVGLGSDFDGAPLPDGIASAKDLPKLVTSMKAAGFDEPLIEKICFGNWRNFLKRHFDTVSATAP